LIPPQILQAQLDNFRQLAAHIYHLPPEQLRAVRPPYGLFTPAILRRLHRWGYRPVMWSLVPHHRMQSVTATLAEVSHQVGPGAILVLHEGWAGPPVATLAGLIITQLQEAGFKFVTIDQMWQAYFAAEDGSP
jgi:peptidoglycan/xylan/chitin deacetylase (PgdA/CDA1 family)